MCVAKPAANLCHSTACLFFAFALENACTERETNMIKRNVTVYVNTKITREQTPCNTLNIMYFYARAPQTLRGKTQDDITK